jgi:uncharacterized protein (TIGR02145 family)
MKTAKLFFSPLRRAKSRRDGTLLTVCFSLRTFSLRAILLPALMFFAYAGLHAQVTIGGLTKPKDGTVLDLNSSAKGGLILSNVALSNLYTIPASFPGMGTPPADAKEKFTGALVYHTGANNIPAGIYAWNGTNWSPATENCMPPDPDNFTLTASWNPALVMKSEAVVFSVSSGAASRCAEGETYEWFRSDVNTGNYSEPAFGTAANATVSFPANGQYKVKVVVTSPYSPLSASKEVNVTVLDLAYGIVGDACLDVKNSYQGKSADVFNARKDGFPENNYTKTYQFVHDSSYSDLNISYVDDPTVPIVTGISQPSVSANSSGSQAFTLTFDPDVRTLAPADGDSLTVQLIASYKPGGSTETRYAYLDIRVEDGTCVCPAKKSATEWLNFMCHNLGGLDIISPSQLITREHHGDWYRFGAKNASMKNTSTNDTRTNSWDNSSYYTAGNWPDNVDANIGNPCPVGWRLPAFAELAAAVNKNTDNSVISPAINPLSNVPASWIPASNQTFGNLTKSGDYLYLPAAGSRYFGDGGLLYRGYYGYYWASTGFDSTSGRYVRLSSEAWPVSGAYRHYGFSVRCVEAE